MSGPGNRLRDGWQNWLSCVMEIKAKIQMQLPPVLTPGCVSPRLCLPVSLGLWSDFRRSLEAWFTAETPTVRPQRWSAHTQAKEFGGDHVWCCDKLETYGVDIPLPVTL